MIGWLHLLFLQLLWPCVSSFRVCAFNAQHFGEKKAANNEVLDVLVKIVQRCDICLLQEVQDPKGRAMSKLMQELNRPEDLFMAVVSPSIGRKTYTEKYAFIYKSKNISVRDQYLYEDNLPSQPDVFAREPYMVRFWLSSPEAGEGFWYKKFPAMQDLVIIPQHTEPEKAAVELQALYDVFMDVRERWRCENVVIMGDFNAGCHYLSKKKKRTLRLFSDPNLHWLISDDIDTTVKESTSCPYDRILVYGNTLVNMVTFSGIYNFTKEQRLTEAQALKVSDHYPVEMNLALTFGSCLSVLPSITIIFLGLLTAAGTKTIL